MGRRGYVSSQGGSRHFPLDPKVSDGGSNQDLMLFIRGEALSGGPSISATNRFPNPPIMIGITVKKIIMKAWAVTTTL